MGDRFQKVGPNHRPGLSVDKDDGDTFGADENVAI